MRFEWDSRNWPRQMAEKKGEVERMSSWAAKRRWVGPTTRVMIGEVRLLLEEEMLVDVNSEVDE